MTQSTIDLFETLTKKEIITVSELILKYGEDWEDNLIGELSRSNSLLSYANNLNSKATVVSGKGELDLEFPEVVATMLFNKDSKYLRYIAMLDSSGSGIVYDYVGGGESQEFLLHNGELSDLPEEEIGLHIIDTFYGRYLTTDERDQISFTVSPPEDFGFESFTQDNGMIRLEYNGGINKPPEVGNTIWERS